MWSNCDDCGGSAWRSVPFNDVIAEMSTEEVESAPPLIFDDAVQAFRCGDCGALGFQLEMAL